MNRPAQRSIDPPSLAGAKEGGPSWLAAAGGLLGGFGAASCCLIPFALFSVGAGGAWIGRLGALSPYQPYFAGFALACLAAGFYVVYRKPKTEACAPDTECARRRGRPAVKAALWIATALVATALAFPYVLPLLV